MWVNDKLRIAQEQDLTRPVLKRFMLIAANRYCSTEKLVGISALLNDNR
jgi:hypothetical protein